jgi:NTE family protein
VFADGDNTEANLRLGVLHSALDDYGSEARVMLQLGETPGFVGEMYKAVNPPLQIYFRPKVFAERRDLSNFDSSGDIVDTYQVTQLGGELDVVRELNRFSAVSVGVRRFSGDAHVEIGDPTLPDYSYNGAEYLVDASLDRLDDRYFPNTGTLASFQYLKSSTKLGADEPYQQVQSLLITAASFGRHTLIGAVKYFMTIDDDAPIYALYRAGGLFNLSGLQSNEAVGQNFGEVFASYRYNLSGKGGLIPAYVGVSAEFGNTGEHHQDPFAEGIMNGSVYFGSRTPIGPLYWGMGFAEDGKRTYFLRIGNVFGRSTIGR